MSSIRLRTLALPFALACLITCGTAALRAQSEQEQKTDSEKKARAEALRRAASSDVNDRIVAAYSQGYAFIDYEMLYQLMDDPDFQVRSIAIEQLPMVILLAPKPQPLPVELAQKIARRIEKEVTQQRIDAAFAPGPFQEHPAAVVLHSVVTLNYLYEHYDFPGSSEDYARWQRRVALPLSIAMLTRSHPSPAKLDSLVHDTLGDLTNAVSDPAALTELQAVAMKNLDAPSLPWNRLLETLYALWHHHLLGKDHPLNPLLLSELSPRLETLRPRFLSGLPQVPEMKYAADMMSEITAAVLAFRQKTAPPPPAAVQK